jgi:hypothetical protein
VPGVRVKREKSILPVNGIVRRTVYALVEERTRCADEPSMYECTNHLSESASLESGGDATVQPDSYHLIVNLTEAVLYLTLSTACR